MEFHIPTQLGVWRLTNEEPRQPDRWVLVMEDGLIVGPDDTVSGTDAHGVPISLTVCFQIFPWMEDRSRRAEEILAARAFLEIDERQAEDAATREQRREKAMENLDEARIIGNEFKARWYEGELRLLDMDDSDDLISDLFAAEAVDDKEEVQRICSDLAVILARADEALLERIQAKLGEERIARYRLSR